MTDNAEPTAKTREDAARTRPPVVCDLCGKVAMYAVTIGGLTVCEQCAHRAWEKVGEP